MSSLKRKISVKEVCGTLPRMNEGDPSRTLMHVIGKANRVKEGIGDYGPWQKLMGQFEAVNLATGEISVAPQCILPEPMNGMVAGQILNAEPGAAPVIEFALEIGVEASGKAGGTGYEFTTRPLVEARETDALSELRKHVPKLIGTPEVTPATPAPEPEAETPKKDKAKKK
jgi:hypothetical protein